uniref:PAS domain-containing protein n=1 Tax=Eptatretus burgeri TaxID=7764 RepID=A0A8C4N9L5_EPTBU
NAILSQTTSHPYQAETHQLTSSCISISEECDLKQQHCEQGVRYIEELAGLLSSNNLELWDFNLRPNKAAALRKVLGQIRSQEYQTEGYYDVKISPLMEIAEKIISETGQQALGGFFFAVNEEGVMVFVSKNVRRYLRYEQKELLGSSVYSLLHVGDHAKFVRILLPKSLDSSPGERSFTCRMLLNPPHEDDNRDVHKPEKPQAYIMMQCFAVPSIALKDYFLFLGSSCFRF